MAEQQTDPFKEKFRPDDSALDKEIEAALGGMSIEDLYDYNKPDPAAAQRAATAIAGGTEGSTGGLTSAPSSRNYRRGRVMSVTKDDVFIDFGGIEGADRHCQTLAAKAGAGGKTWRAYLSVQAIGGATAVNARDYSVVMGLTVLLSVIIIFANLIVDILYGILDPRTRDART